MRTTTWTISMVRPDQLAKLVEFVGSKDNEVKVGDMTKVKVVQVTGVKWGEEPSPWHPAARLTVELKINVQGGGLPTSPMAIDEANFSATAIHAVFEILNLFSL